VLIYYRNKKKALGGYLDIEELKGRSIKRKVVISFSDTISYKFPIGKPALK
jgi:hypothetical protein